jgi:hypothetical protein
MGTSVSNRLMYGIDPWYQIERPGGPGTMGVHPSENEVPSPR